MRCPRCNERLAADLRLIEDDRLHIFGLRKDDRVEITPSIICPKEGIVLASLMDSELIATVRSVQPGLELFSIGRQWRRINWDYFHLRGWVTADTPLPFPRYGRGEFERGNSAE
jgi:hypothetical protein